VARHVADRWIEVKSTLGLCAVDRKTFERRPKPSAFWFGEVAKTNAIVAPS